MSKTEDGNQLSRRDFLLKSSAYGLSAVVISGSSIIAYKEAWGLEVKNLKPETMKTIIQVARDIYPHDRVPDRYYAIACKPFDSAEFKPDIEEAINLLNKLAQSKFNKNYIDVGWETDRVSLLEQIETTKMFSTLRSSLVTGLYNQKEIWPIFGYQGASYEHGGYIDRGFNDIDWL